MPLNNAGQPNLHLLIFEIKYWSGRSNKNVDTLSHQPQSGLQEVEAMAPGTSLANYLHKVLPERVEVIQAAVTVLPGYTSSDIYVL